MLLTATQFHRCISDGASYYYRSHLILIELAFPWQKVNANALGIPDKEFPFPTKKRKMKNLLRKREDKNNQKNERGRTITTTQISKGI